MKSSLSIPEVPSSLTSEDTLAVDIPVTAALPIPAWSAHRLQFWSSPRGGREVSSSSVAVSLPISRELAQLSSSGAMCCLSAKSVVEEARSCLENASTGVSQQTTPEAAGADGVTEEDAGT